MRFRPSVGGPFHLMPESSLKTAPGQWALHLGEGSAHRTPSSFLILPKSLVRVLREVDALHPRRYWPSHAAAPYFRSKAPSYHCLSFAPGSSTLTTGLSTRFVGSRARRILPILGHASEEQRRPAMDDADQPIARKLPSSTSVSLLKASRQRLLIRRCDLPEQRRARLCGFLKKHHAPQGCGDETNRSRGSISLLYSWYHRSFMKSSSPDKLPMRTPCQ